MRHNVGTGSIELLDRCIGRIAFDTCVLRLFLYRRGGYIYEAVLVDSNVVILGRDVLLGECSLLCAHERTPHKLKGTYRDRLRTDKVLKFALRIKYDNAHVCGGRNDIDTLCIVDRDRDRLVDRAGREYGRLRLTELIEEASVSVENNYTAVVRIGNEYLLCGDKDTVRLCELIANTLLVYEGLNSRLVLEVGVKDKNSVIAGIGEIYIILIIHLDIGKIIEVSTGKAYILGMVGLIRGICIRRGCGNTECCVGISLIG